MKREPCVLLQWFQPDDQLGPNAGLLIENLRAAGVVSVIKETHKDDGVFILLEIRCPRGPYDMRNWADANASRMKSFGLNAEASWKEIK